MCDPVSIAAVSTFGTVGTQLLNQSASKAYGQSMSAAYKAVADTNAVQGYAAVQAQQEQQHAAATKEINNVVTQAAAASGSARTAAGEAGVAGNSVAALQDDFARTELNYQTTIIRNRAFADDQLRRNLDAIRANQQGQILAGVPKPVAGVDVISPFANLYGKELEISQSNQNQQPLG